MAGERLIELINSKAGKASDKSDVMYGIVTSVKPLKVQLSNQMIITDDFITLGKHIGKFKIKGTISNHHESKANGDADFEIDNGLQMNDKVTLIRGNGGQQFYLFERQGIDGSGF